jgi:hypothetical protein
MPGATFGPKQRLELNEVRRSNQVPLRERNRNGKRHGKTNIHFIANEVERNKAKSQRRSTMFKKVTVIYLSCHSCHYDYL